MSEIYLVGVIEDIVFSNEDNGYTVCIIDHMGEPTTLVGIMPFLSVGETIRVSGSWHNHPTFGRQFKVEYFEKKFPTTSATILKYLSSGAIKGVGPVTAERIVSRFGEDSLDIIENNPEWLSDIRGISLKKAREISNTYKMQFGMRAVMMFCEDFFGPSLSVSIFKKYGSAAIDLIKSNPYMLCEDIAGIGFQTSDKIAQSLDFPFDSPQRVRAGIIHFMQLAAYNGGHCYLPEWRLIDMIESALGVDNEIITNTLSTMVSEEELILTKVGETGVVFLREYYDAESYIAAKLLVMSETEFPFVLSGVSEHIADLEARYELEYAIEQREAVIAAVTRGVTVVTGGPGTGKTTVIKAIIDIFRNLGYSFVLAAPTGRAAKRMSEASGTEAKTIHRLLEMEYSEERKPRFYRTESNPLPFKAVIIDEVSMVDTLLLDSLLRAVKTDSYLILIGDADQLPPVGAGNCLADIIESERFSVKRLTKIFRQAEESLIITNAHSINQGRMPRLDVTDNNFFFIKRHSFDTILDTIIDLTANRLPKKYKIDPVWDIQVITPTRKGQLGTFEMNKALQESLNPKGPTKIEKQIGKVVFRENDKVMQTKNNYEIEWFTAEPREGEEPTGQGVFNGDIGRILSIDTKAETVVIDFDNRIAEYDFSLLGELEHAYAITVHKSQGSEYNYVILPSFGFPAPLMTRNLLYTGVTRAKELVCIVGEDDNIRQMITNDKKPVRHTALKEFIWGIKPKEA